MAKKPPKSDSGPKQMSLLEILERRREESTAQRPPDVGALNIEARMRLALSAALKHCQRSVHQVAGEMSHLLNENITADMIYSWTAESKTQHQIWAGRLPAFCIATGDARPMELLVEASGRFCLSGREALRAEAQRHREAEKKERHEARRCEVLLKEMEERR